VTESEVHIKRMTKKTMVRRRWGHFSRGSFQPCFRQAANRQKIS
jgi:hypothetical protein